MHEKNGRKIPTLPSPPSPLTSMAPVADSSTRVDSPSHGLVTSSLCSPSQARLSQTPHSQPSRPGTYKVRGGGSFSLTQFSFIVCSVSGFPSEYCTHHILSLPFFSPQFLISDKSFPLLLLPVYSRRCFLTLSLTPLQMSVATQCDPEEIIVLSDSD